MARLPTGSTRGPAFSTVSRRPSVEDLIGGRNIQSPLGQTSIARIRTSVADTSAAGRGLSRAGAGLADLGRSLHNVDIRNVQREIKELEFDTEMRFQDFVFEQGKLATEARQGAAPGAGGFADGVNGNYTGAAKDFLAGVDPLLKDEYDAKLFATQRTIFRGAKTFERGEKRRFSVEQLGNRKEEILAGIDSGAGLDESKKLYSGFVKGNPNLSVIQQGTLSESGLREIEFKHASLLPAAEVEAALNSGAYSHLKDADRQKLISTAVDNAIDNGIQAGPEELKKVLADPFIQKHTEPGEREKARTAANRKALADIKARRTNAIVDVAQKAPELYERALGIGKDQPVTLNELDRMRADAELAGQDRSVLNMFDELKKVVVQRGGGGCSPDVIQPFMAD